MHGFAKMLESRIENAWMLLKRLSRMATVRFGSVRLRETAVRFGRSGSFHPVRFHRSGSLASPVPPVRFGTSAGPVPPVRFQAVQGVHLVTNFHLKKGLKKRSKKRAKKKSKKK